MRIRLLLRGCLLRLPCCGDVLAFRLRLKKARSFLMCRRLKRSSSACSSWLRSKRAMWFMISVRATAGSSSPRQKNTASRRSVLKLTRNASKNRTKILKRRASENLVEIRQQDIRTVDLSPATVLTMYLLPEVNLMIRPNIWKQMKPGSRVVSHDFDMGDWKPLKTEHIKDGSSWDHTLYLWHVEAAKK